MNRKNRHMFQFVVFCVVVMISLLIGLVVYYNSLLASLQKATRTTQGEVLRQEQYNFSKTLAADQLMLKGFAETSTIAMEDKQSLLQMLDAIQRSTDFEYASFADTDGTSINNKGDITNIADRDYFHSAMSGNTVISEPVHSKIRDANVIVAATPVIEGGQTVGVLFGSLEAKKLGAWFVNSFNGYGYTYIATNEGELIVRSDNKHALAETGNIFDLLRLVEFDEPGGYDKLRKNLVTGRGGEAWYSYQGQQRVMQYDKLAINDWNIFTVVNPQGVESTASQMLRNAILLTGGMTLIFIVLLFYNLYSQKCFTREFTKMAYVDEVTGCQSFSKFRANAAELMRVNLGRKYMLIKMDIDNFKTINDIYGMKTGNQILRAVAEALTVSLDEMFDTFGRIHADEFILLIGCEDEAEQSRKWQQFEHALGQSSKAMIGFNLVLPRGRYCLVAGEDNLEEAYEKVNFAHRLAKSGDSKEVYYDGKVRERVIRERKIESRMDAALQKEEFQLFLRPQYRNDGDKIVGAETSVRWLSDIGTMIYPDEFMPFFEQNGFVVQLDMYLFEQSCKTLCAWVEAGIPTLTIAVNFSNRHLYNPDFVRNLSEIADRYHVRHELLEIKLTEMAILENLDVLSKVLEALREALFTLPMDDFGTGYYFTKPMSAAELEVRLLREILVKGK